MLHLEAISTLQIRSVPLLVIASYFHALRRLQALKKRVNDLCIDLWNLAQQYIMLGQTSTSTFEAFLNARYAQSKYRFADGHLFAAEDQLRAVLSINEALDECARIVDKYERAREHPSALKKLAAADDVPKLLRARINVLATLMPKLTRAFLQDLEWRRDICIRAPTANDNESIALVAAWRESAQLLGSHIEQLHSLVV